MAVFLHTLESILFDVPIIFCTHREPVTIIVSKNWKITGNMEKNITKQKKPLSRGRERRDEKKYVNWKKIPISNPP